MDKSNGDGVETENSLTLGVIGVAVRGPEEATSGLAKLLLSWSRENHFRFDGNRKYRRQNSQINNPKASGRHKSTPGDLRRRIFTFR